MKSLMQRSQQLFNIWASVYDSPLSRWFFNHYYQKAEIYLQDLDHKSVLSAGCGTGTLEIRLAHRYPHARIVGIDISDKMLQKAQEKIGHLQNIKFNIASSDSLQLPDHLLDVVICIHSFHHYPDQLQSLKEFKRVLKPGGFLLLLDGVKDEGLGRFYLRLNMIYEPGVFYHHSKDLKTFIANAGFAHVDIYRMDATYRIFICR